MNYYKIRFSGEMSIEAESEFDAIDKVSENLAEFVELDIEEIDELEAE